MAYEIMGGVHEAPTVRELRDAAMKRQQSCLEITNLARQNLKTLMAELDDQLKQITTN